MRSTSLGVLVHRFDFIKRGSQLNEFPGMKATPCVTLADHPGTRRSWLLPFEARPQRAASNLISHPNAHCIGGKVPFLEQLFLGLFLGLGHGHRCQQNFLFLLV